MKESLKLAIFASGSGSNAESIMRAAEKGQLDAEVRLVIASKLTAGVTEKAENHDVSCIHLMEENHNTRKGFVEELLSKLDKYEVNFIALAGYLKMIYPEIIARFQNRITNIHPALLPLFGGKGYYGLRVHEAVLDAGCKVSGVTVHLVDEEYDHGPILAQRTVPVLEGDTPELLAKRVLYEEHKIYPEALQLFADDRVRILNGKAIIKEPENNTLQVDKLP